MRKYAKLYNAIVSFLLRLGLPMGPQALLTVTGRRSGLPRTTPVAINRSGDGWHLISVYGRVDWVWNLEAAGRALITRRLQRFQVTARQLTPDEAAPGAAGDPLHGESLHPLSARSLLRRRSQGPARSLAGRGGPPPGVPAHPGFRTCPQLHALRHVYVTPCIRNSYSTVTVLARLRGLSTSMPFAVAT